MRQPLLLACDNATLQSFGRLRVSLDACVYPESASASLPWPTTHNKFVTQLLAEWHKMLGNPAVLEQHSHIPWLNNSCTPAPRR
jgi:hypothetical protein